MNVNKLLLIVIVVLVLTIFIVSLKMQNVSIMPYPIFPFPYRPIPIKPIKHYIGGCSGTRYGCCPFSTRACADQECSNC
tara:strand:- start:13793 stop:14029 length:237 start_codon:yes stop_codon:yes gene_type:complete